MTGGSSRWCLLLGVEPGGNMAWQRVGNEKRGAFEIICQADLIFNTPMFIDS